MRLPVDGPGPQGRERAVSFRDHDLSHSSLLTCGLAMAWAMRGRLFVSVLGVRQFGSQRIPDLFSTITAEFVAAAGSVSSIPRLMGLPEVAKTRHCDSYSMYII